jgi:hypothetical protein
VTQTQTQTKSAKRGELRRMPASGEPITVEGRPIAVAELAHGDGGGTEPREADGDDDEPVYAYVMVTKNGMISHFDDDRSPMKMRVELKLALAYPLVHDSMWTEAEEAYAEQLVKEDQRRYGKKEARIYAFTVGEVEDDDGDDAGYIIDPREVVAIIPANMYGPLPPDDEDDDEGDGTPSAPAGPGEAPGAAREQLRRQLGR